MSRRFFRISELFAAGCASAIKFIGIERSFAGLGNFGSASGKKKKNNKKEDLTKKIQNSKVRIQNYGAISSPE